MTEQTTELTGEAQLGHHWSFNLRNDPKRLSFVLARYKFAAHVISPNSKIAEIGCGEGVGTALLGKACQSYSGFDIDEEAIMSARQNFTDPRYEFLLENCYEMKTQRSVHAVVSLDVIEHIEQAREIDFFQAILGMLTPQGICVVGTPSVRAEAYQSEMSRIGHINLFDPPRLRQTMAKYFENVFLFGMNDELLHTGPLEAAHYLLALGCGPRMDARLGK